MILVKYQAMLLLLAVMLICQSLAESPPSVLTNPRQLQVRRDPSRATIVVSRTVTPTTEPPTTPATTPSTSTTTEAASASNVTTTQSSTVPTTPPTPPPSKTTGAIELGFAAIRELNANFTEVGVSSHSFNRFNDQNLGFLSMNSLTPAVRNQLPQSNSVRAMCMDSRATLSRAGADAPNGTVIAKLCAVESNGRVIRDGEDMEVRIGQFQLSVEIADWQWCGCGQLLGSFLEFELSISVPSGYKISFNNNRTSSNMPVKISLGTNDSFVMLSSKYEVMAGSGNNAAWKSMPNGYPKVTLFDEAVARRVDVKARVPRRDSGDRITVMALIVEPGYISSEHIQKPTSAAPPYVATPMIQLIASASFVVIAAIFSRH